MNCGESEMGGTDVATVLKPKSGVVVESVSSLRYGVYGAVDLPQSMMLSISSGVVFPGENTRNYCPCYCGGNTISKYCHR